MKKIAFTGTSLFAALVLFLSACNQPTTPTSNESSAAPLETAISSTAPTTTAEETSLSTTTTSATTTLTQTKRLTQKPTQKPTTKAPTKKPTTKVPAPTEDQQQAALDRYNAAMQKILSRKTMNTRAEMAMDMSFGGITVHTQIKEEQRISDNQTARALFRDTTTTMGESTFETKEYMGNGHYYLYNTEYPEQSNVYSITDAELTESINEVFGNITPLKRSDLDSFKTDGNTLEFHLNSQAATQMLQEELEDGQQVQIQDYTLCITFDKNGELAKEVSNAKFTMSQSQGGITVESSVTLTYTLTYLSTDNLDFSVPDWAKQLEQTA